MKYGVIENEQDLFALLFGIGDDWTNASCRRLFEKHPEHLSVDGVGDPWKQRESHDPDWAADAPFFYVPKLSEIVRSRHREQRFKLRDAGFGFESLIANYKDPEYFFAVPWSERQLAPSLDRALRIFEFNNIPLDKVGAGHYHRTKKEWIMVLNGELEWELEDVYGERRTYSVKRGQAFYVPPGIWHDYRVSGVDENTKTADFYTVQSQVYDPNNRVTYDEFHKESFSLLQQRCQLSKSWARIQDQLRNQYFIQNGL